MIYAVLMFMSLELQYYTNGGFIHVNCAQLLVDHLLEEEWSLNIQ